MSANLKVHRKRRPRSCITCHARKVRCDRQRPCGECEPKGLTCIYQTDIEESQTPAPPSIDQFRGRHVITLNATKALDSYWQDFHRTGRISDSCPAFDVVTAPQRLGPLNSLIPPANMAMELVWAGQASNVLQMFSVAAEMTMPYFKTFFNPQLSTMFWKLLTRPVHVDLTIGYDDPSWKLEQTAAKNERILRGLQRRDLELRRQSQSSPDSESSSSRDLEPQMPIPMHATKGGFSLSRSKVMPDSPPLPPELEMQPHPVFVDTSRIPVEYPTESMQGIAKSGSPSIPLSARSLGEDSSNASTVGPNTGRSWFNTSLLEPSFAPDEFGLFQAPIGTGRRFDALTDFLLIKSPRVEDVMSLLEYGVAFLRGSSFLGWSEVNTLIGFNVERIVHSLMYQYRSQLDLRMVDRLVNCISIFALQREYSGQFDSIAPYLMFAYHISCDVELDKIDPQGVCRMLLTTLYYTGDPILRDYYEKEALTRFANLTGIVLRTRFAYVSGALLTPESEPIASDPLYWKKVEEQLIEAEYILPHLDSASDLPAASTILFKCLFAAMRAELGPRVDHHEWPLKQACLIADHLCSLGDHNTFIATGLLVRFRLHARRSSVKFIMNGKSMLVADYLADQIRAIPTMPVVPIIPGEEPFLADASQMFDADIPVVPDEKHLFGNVTKSSSKKSGVRRPSPIVPPHIIPSTSSAISLAKHSAPRSLYNSAVNASSITNQTALSFATSSSSAFTSGAFTSSSRPSSSAASLSSSATIMNSSGDEKSPNSSEIHSPQEESSTSTTSLHGDHNMSGCEETPDAAGQQKANAAGDASDASSASSSIPISDSKSPFVKDAGPDIPPPQKDSTYSKSIIGY